MRQARIVWLVVASFLAISAFGRELPNFNKFGTHAPEPGKAAQLTQKAQALGLVKKGAPLSSEPRLGVPTFLWPSAAAATLPASFHAGSNVNGGTAEAAARGYLGSVASLYNLDQDDVMNASVKLIHNVGSGPVIVKLQQKLDGIEIFNEELNVVMNQQLKLVAFSGYITSQTVPASAQAGSLNFRLAQSNVASSALRDATMVNVPVSQFVPAGSHDGYDYFTLPASAGVVLEEPIRVKKVYYHDTDGLVPAYYLEVIAQDPGVDMSEVRIDDHRDATSAFGYVISAVDGSVLFRHNLVADAASHTGGANLAPGGFTYRVWADPSSGIPYDTPAGNSVHPKINATPDGVQYPFVSTQDVQLPNFPFSQNDPWLAPGSTQSTGNNVEAFVNLVNASGNVDNGFGPAQEPPADPPTGDHHAFTSAANSFLYNTTPDVDAYSVNARQGAITQLFYNINFLHDWYYDSGFDEISGNAQTNNYGRGGLGSDSIKAQSQDTSSFSNANMLTPADGSRPRMRMYNFPNPANMLQVTAPAAIAGKIGIGISMTGLRNFDVTSDIVIATFSNSPSACTVTNAAALAGKIAMFDFDNTDGTGCSFSTRITRIHATSAAAALMVYTSANANAVANVTGIVASHTKGTGIISWNNGQIIKGQLASTTVTARLLRVADRDGSLDQQIVFHEWGHYLSNRLIGNGNGLNTNFSGGMGEGWGDFSAMMLTVRENDTNTASNDNWQGAYALATYATSGVPYTGAANQGYYFGIRRYPYSTDMTKNPLTYKYIANGNALPVGPPLGFGADGSNNAEVHNTGEVWTTMLWECYASMLRDTLGPNPRLDFATAQKRMKAYLVASLKITPLYPTMLETRDAVLAAAYATDVVDYEEFAAAFAKRGAGTFATSPDRFSSTNSPLTESFVVGADLTFVGATLDDSYGTCDNDGAADGGESGKLTITLHNAGDQTLTATTGLVTSANSNVTFPNGNHITFSSSDPYGDAVGNIALNLAPGTAGVQAIDLSIDFDDPSLTIPGPRNVSTYVRGNTNVIPASTATDTFEATPSAWTTFRNPSLANFPWVLQQQPGGINHVWYVPDAYTGSEQILTSPVFTVNGGGSLNVQLDHSWGFEFDAGGNYDGAVIEASINGGAWGDLDTSVYNGTILNYSGDVNPLKGRLGFVQNSGTVHTSLTKAIAPGSTVQIRFRFGSDSSAGSTGWTIDNVQFNGVVETPFATIVSDTGCTATTTTTLSSSANPAPAGASLTLTATVSSLRGAPSVGTVTFYDGVNVLGSSSVAAGVATLSTSALTVGSHSLTATYSGATNYGSSTSLAYTQTVTKAASTTVVTASVTSPSAYGQPITFFAMVTASNGATPTGSVSFYVDNALVSTAALNGSGVATWATVGLTGGTHIISATYLGSATIATSTGQYTHDITSGSVISFSAASYDKFENAGTVTLTVTRTGGNTSGPASVTLTTANGTATAGVRYTALSTTVNFPANVTSTTVDVTLLNNSTIEGRQSFTATLSAPSAAVLTGGISTATVNIIDDDAVNSDFSAPSDGNRDLLWRNDTTGDTRAWLMNNTTLVSATTLQRYGSEWKLVGTGDFNADGKADILWRNSNDQTLSVWYMNGTNLSSIATVPGSTDPNWVPVAIADMNGDGYPDVIWRHKTTFNASVWLMHDTTMLSIVSLPTVADANWQLIGTGDFNRDHKTDLVWRNSATLDVAVWLMNGTTFTTAAFLPKVGSPWSLVAVGDMNADGDADLIWQASTTHTIAVWQMNQTALGTVVTINTAADAATANDPNWKIVSPR